MRRREFYTHIIFLRVALHIYKHKDNVIFFFECLYDGFSITQKRL